MRVLAQETRLREQTLDTMPEAFRWHQRPMESSFESTESIQITFKQLMVTE
jgi:hypothetical protein